MDTGTDRNMDRDMDRDADPVNEAMAIFMMSNKKFANYRTVQTFLTKRRNIMTCKIIDFAETATGTLLQIFIMQNISSNQQHIFKRIFTNMPISANNFLQHASCPKRCYSFSCHTAIEAIFSGN
jgi:hypothetical protein